MTTPDPDELEYTRRLETGPGQVPVSTPESLEGQPAPPVPPSYAPAAPEPVYSPLEAPGSPSGYAYAPYEAQRTADSSESVLYVPLAVTVGDGFKFGCGFFMAGVTAALVGFVLMAALFLLSSLAGMTLPLGR